MALKSASVVTHCPMLSRVSSMTHSCAFRIGSHFIGRQLSGCRMATGAWGRPPSMRMTSGPATRSEHQYIHGRVYVSVVNGSAVGTCPFPDLQRHLGLHRAATGAGLACRREAVRDHQHAPMPLALIFNLPAQFTKRGITHGLCQPGSGQPFYAQVFNGNQAMVTDKRGCLFVQEVFSSISDTRMNTCNAFTLFVPAIRSCLLAAQTALRHFQPALIPAQIARVSRFATVAGHDDIFQAHVDANAFSAGRDWFNIFLNHEGDEKPSARITTHGDHFRNATWNPRPADINSPESWKFQKLTGTVRTGNLALIHLEADSRCMPTFLEARVARPLLKEVRESAVLVSQSLNQYHGRNFFQPLVGIKGFQPRQFTREVNCSHPIAIGLIGHGSPCERSIPHPTRSAKVSTKQRSLGVRWVKSELVRPLNHGVNCTALSTEKQYRYGQDSAQCSHRSRFTRSTEEASANREPRPQQHGRDSVKGILAACQSQEAGRGGQLNTALASSAPLRYVTAPGGRHLSRDFCNG